MNLKSVFNQAWKLIWRDWRIWVFSLFTLGTSLIPNTRETEQLSVLCLYFIFALLFLFLSLVGQSGIVYNVRSLLYEEYPTLKETFDSLKPNLIRIAITILIPGLLSFIFIILPITVLTSFFLSVAVRTLLFSAMWIYIVPYLTTMFVSIVLRPSPIIENIKFASVVVSRNLYFLLGISFILHLVRPIYQQVSALVTVVAQSGFSLNALESFNFGVYSELSSSPYIIVLDQFFLLLFTPFSLAVYTLAYLHFTKDLSIQNPASPDSA